MGDRSPSWENGDRSPSRLHHDEDVVVIDAPLKGKLPHLPLEPLAFDCVRPNLQDVDPSVRREEEDFRNLAIIDNSDKDRRSKEREAGRDMLAAELPKDFVSEEAIEEAINGVGSVFEETETLAKYTENTSRRIFESQAEWEVSLDPWWRRNRSRQEPCNPLSLFKETPHITNLAPSHKISKENRTENAPSTQQFSTQNSWFTTSENERFDASSSDQLNSGTSLWDSATVNAIDIPVSVGVGDHSLKVLPLKKREREKRKKDSEEVELRKPRILTVEGKAHAKAVRNSGGACEYCKVKRTKARDPWIKIWFQHAYDRT